ncbi:MAG: L,D-transpeptidase family protein [Parvibaculum sp.]|nr:L,D-transpeptidase family protein [Parvibaculum sp.]
MTDFLKTEILVTAPPRSSLGVLDIGGRRYPCALGRAGLVDSKREGDGGTPLGRFVLRELRYRQDRLTAPAAALPLIPISPDDGWCDAPDDPAYNRPVRLPYPASAETMWRADHLYDLVVVLGQNDDPVVPGAGSAIFFHLARESGGVLQPTEGCVALKPDDMREVLALCGPDSAIRIERR